MTPPKESSQNPPMKTGLQLTIRSMVSTRISTLAPRSWQLELRCSCIRRWRHSSRISKYATEVGAQGDEGWRFLGTQWSIGESKILTKSVCQKHLAPPAQFADVAAARRSHQFNSNCDFICAFIAAQHTQIHTHTHAAPFAAV